MVPLPMAEVLSKAADEQFCKSCGVVIKIKAELCPKCGVRQRQTKSRTTAAVLALLFGGLGIHKFYLGQAGLGLLYLVCFWTFIPMIVGFVEGILLLAMSDDRFAEKYLER
jgi:TM2 domain-containing membrane protein YozV